MDKSYKVAMALSPSDLDFSLQSENPLFRLYTATHRQTSKTYVCKEFTANSTEAYREMEIHRTASRLTTGVVRYMGECVRGGRLAFVTEECPRGSLKDVCDWNVSHGQKWTEAEVLKIAQSMLQIVQRLHSAHIVHLNIRAENWLLDSEKRLRLSDFSNARLVQTSGDYFSTDIFDIGKTLYHVTFSKECRYGDIGYDILQQDIASKVTHEGHSPQLTSLLFALLTYSSTLPDYLTNIETALQALD